MLKVLSVTLFTATSMSCAVMSPFGFASMRANISVCRRHVIVLRLTQHLSVWTPERCSNRAKRPAVTWMPKAPTTHHHDHELSRRLQATNVCGKVLHLSDDTKLLWVSASSRRKAMLVETQDLCRTQHTGAAAASQASADQCL